MRKLSSVGAPTGREAKTIRRQALITLSEIRNPPAASGKTRSTGSVDRFFYSRCTEPKVINASL
jgi:hypothetical protein